MQTRIHQLILTIAALALVATACGDSSADTTVAPVATEAPASTAAPTTQAPAATEATTTTVATTTTTSTTTTTTIPLGELPVLEAAGSTAPAGTYASTSLSVPFRVTLSEARDVWHGNGFVGILPVGASYLNAATLTFAEFAGLPLPEQVEVHHPAVPPLAEISGSADWTSFFADTAGPTLLDSGTDTIGGISAPWWEFTADTSGGFPDCDLGSHCFNVGYIEVMGGFFVIGEEATVQMWKLDHADGTLYAWYQAPSGMFADGLDFAYSILDTVTVGG